MNVLKYVNALHDVNENVQSQINGDARGSFRYLVKLTIKILLKDCEICVNAVYDGDEFQLFNDGVELQSDDD